MPGTGDGAPLGRSSACRADVDLFSCQRAYYPKSLLPKIRGAANGKGETSRERKSPAQELYVGPAEVSPQAAYSGEARAPKTIIQEGKKGIRGLMLVFMKIQPVTGFSEKY
jgi:hypothetical protein